ncbi:Cell division protein FtsA [uncultured spirochete]|uniref:Cell division protein FtsA n=1 Tax=uncultured spirochete TaxID=156406 RepID=A0A3P3XG51_9SPIR|nr:Cell division protein FtsA [uncultured spirochete]
MIFNQALWCIKQRRPSLADTSIVALDIGTSVTKAIVGAFDENGEFEIIGIGTALSNGLRRGVVLNIEGTLNSITSALDAAELMSGADIRAVSLALSGANVESFNTNGQVAITGRGREITQEDIVRVHEAARAVSISMDREILHVIPRSYTVDEQKGVRNPLHMTGVRLECGVHIITGSVSTVQNMFKCVTRAGYRVEQSYLGILGSARCVLTDDERDLGCLLIDIGGGTTDFMVFADSEPVFTSAIPAGGSQITGDISIMLSIPVDAAERLKKESGASWADAIDPEETVIVPGFGAREPVELERRKLVSIVQPRVEEIFEMVNERLVKNGLKEYIKAGVVLTGGSALLPHIDDCARAVFGVPVRIGTPLAIQGLDAEYRSPAFSAVVGVALLEAERTGAVSESSGRKKVRKGKQGSFSLFKWIKDRFF